MRLSLIINSYFFFAISFFASSATLGDDTSRVGESGAPIPRFISIAANKSYMRTGPGRQYPIKWVYQRKNLPIKVIDEHGPWRKVEDFEGVNGWIHRSLLSPKRTAIIINSTQVLRNKPGMAGTVKARLQQGVIAEIDECSPTWCKLELTEVSGWLPRGALFGLLDQEILD